MLGAGVGLRMIDSGYKVAAYNRTRSATVDLENAGAAIMDTPRDVAASSDFVIICVTDADAVRSVVFGDDGVAAGAHDGLVVGDMSTIDPDDSRKIADRMHAECGIKMLGVPVMGGPDAAKAGTLVVIADGDKQAYNACSGVLGDISQAVHYVGTNGTAHTIKIAMNLQIASLALSLSEGIEIVRGGDVDPELFLTVLNSTYFGTGMSKKKAHNMVRGEYSPTFLLRNLKKDLGLIMGFIDARKIRLDVAKAIDGAYADAVAAGLGELDYTGIHKHIQSGSPKRA